VVRIGIVGDLKIVQLAAFLDNLLACGGLADFFTDG
jgi:hypothetical protein